MLLAMAVLLLLATTWYGASAKTKPDNTEQPTVTPLVHALSIDSIDRELFPIAVAESTHFPLNRATVPVLSVQERPSKSDKRLDSCQQLLGNPTLDIANGSVAPWEVFISAVYYSTRSYVSPQYSLVLVDADLGDTSPTADAFGQLFAMPSNLTLVTVRYYVFTSNSNAADTTFVTIWSVENDELVDILVGWEIADAPNTWEERSAVIQSQEDLAHLAGRRLAILLVTITDGQSPGEQVYLDDITLTACTGSPPSNTATPTSTPSARHRRAFVPLMLHGHAIVPPPTPTPWVTPTPTPWCDPYEPNNSVSQAWGPMVSGTTYRARLCWGDIEDNYYLNAQGGTPIEVSIVLPESLIGQTSFYIYHNEQPVKNPDCHRGPIRNSPEIVTCPITSSGRYVLRMYTSDSSQYYDNQQDYTLTTTFRPLPPTHTPTPTYTPRPTNTPTPTYTPRPTNTPTPTYTARLTNTPTPTRTATTTPGAGTTQRTLYAVADTTIMEGYPSYNFGTTVDMWAGYDDSLDPYGRIVRSLIRFDLSGLPPAAVVQSAVLRVYYVGYWDFPNHVATITAYQINGSWTETGVTWNNRPNPGASYGSVDIPANQNWGWRELDVKALVQGWLNGSIPNQGVMLRGPEISGIESCWRSFSTREGPYPPQLVVTYTTAGAAERTVATNLPATVGGPRLRDLVPGFSVPSGAGGRELKEMAY